MTFDLLNTFDTLQKAVDQFSNELPDYITQNINPKFSIRDYQAEAFNRFDFYLTTYKKRVKPTLGWQTLPCGLPPIS